MNYSRKLWLTFLYRDCWSSSSPSPAVLWLYSAPVGIQSSVSTDCPAASVKKKKYSAYNFSSKSQQSEHCMFKYLLVASAFCWVFTNRYCPEAALQKSSYRFWSLMNEAWHEDNICLYNCTASLEKKNGIWCFGNIWEIGQIVPSATFSYQISF